MLARAVKNAGGTARAVLKPAPTTALAGTGKYTSVRSAPQRAAPVLPSVAEQAHKLARRLRENALREQISGASATASPYNGLSGALSAGHCEPSSTDVLVLGCGIAGAAAALQAAKHGMKVIMLSAASKATDCNSYWAQGGIIYKSNDDTPSLLAADVQAAGAGMCDHPAVMKLAIDGPKRVEEILLQTANVPFDRSSSGELALCLEASHSRARIIHWRDQTGMAITTSVQAAAARHPNITMVQGAAAVDMALAYDNKCNRIRCVGAHVMQVNGEMRTISAPATVLATGGLGEIYAHTSNPASARGDGFALALRAGAGMRNMEYVQFHPTTLYLPGERSFLLTEALRGEGAKLVDSRGRRFAHKYHPDGELAPRDVVTRAIVSEMRRQGASNMYLDISHRGAEWARKRFPGVYAHCIARGLDIGTDLLPVVPAAHYFCGGVDTDLLGRTTLPGLMAAGEVACTGLHGANRLASTSLLEGLVWGCQISDHLASRQSAASRSELSLLEDKVAAAVPLPPPSTGCLKVNSDAINASWAKLKNTMWDDVGVVRTHEGLERAVHVTTELAKKAEQTYASTVACPEVAALRNATGTAALVAQAASLNPTSAGCHFVDHDAEEHAELAA